MNYSHQKLDARPNELMARIIWYWRENVTFPLSFLSIYILVRKAIEKTLEKTQWFIDHQKGYILRDYLALIVIFKATFN